jgi:NAD(P)H-dependent FMN reductase
MANILGIVGSARRWGNSELMVRQVLQGARADDNTVQMLRLTSLRLDSCTGCMRCVIGDKPCPIDDDMAWLIDTVQAADALVLAAPTHFLGPAAVVKLVLDRLLMVSAEMDGQAAPIRPAVTVITAGLADWRGVSLPYLNALVSTFGFRPIESLNAIAPGPGEVLLDEDLMARALTAGERLGRGELDPAPASPGVCPFCHCDSFILTGDRAVCPICGQEAAIQQLDDGTFQLNFDATRSTEHRWTTEALNEHMESWVRATGPRFMARRSEIKSRRQPYRAMEVSWLCPPSEARSTSKERQAR